MKEHQEGRGTAPPGTERGKRLRPKFHYELIGCGLRGHELLGTDVATIRPVDDLLVREPGDGLRWYRCVRCDAWVPLAPPLAPTREHLPDRSEIALPLRGRPLRDRYVLRLIAVDRLGPFILLGVLRWYRRVHFIVLGVLAVAVFLFAANRVALSHTFYRVLDAVQGGVGGPNGQGGGGILQERRRACAEQPSTGLFAR